MKQRITSSLAVLALIVAGIVGFGSPALATACGGSACLYYAGGQASPTTREAGIYAAMDVEKPVLKTTKGDNHSLAEMTVQDSVTGDTLELGWNVDPTLNGDSNPHLFTFYWAHGVPKGYNTGLGTTTDCGVASFSSPVPGGTFTGSFPLLLTFGIAHAGTWPNGAWFFKAGPTGWAGCIKDAILVANGVTTDFSTGDFFQLFGEVASQHDLSMGTAPCAQMGSGVKGSLAAGPPAAARIANASYASGAFPSLTLFASGPGASSSYYNTATLGASPWSGRSFYYGGTGATTNPPC